MRIRAKEIRRTRKRAQERHRAFAKAAKPMPAAKAKTAK
jgi:hypothetical protein